MASTTQSRLVRNLNMLGKVRANEYLMTSTKAWYSVGPRWAPLYRTFAAAENAMRNADDVAEEVACLVAEIAQAKAVLESIDVARSDAAARMHTMLGRWVSQARDAMVAAKLGLAALHASTYAHNPECRARLEEVFRTLSEELGDHERLGATAISHALSTPPPTPRTRAWTPVPSTSSLVAPASWDGGEGPIPR